MKKIKFNLPRKRKKRAKKILGYCDYFLCLLVNEVIFEDRGRKPRFPEKYDKTKTKVLKYF